MQLVEGFVLIASRPEAAHQRRLDFLYGPNTNPKYSEAVWRLQSNGLVLFNSWEEVVKQFGSFRVRLKNGLKGMNFEEVGVGNIRLVIADKLNWEETAQFKNEDQLVLVGEMDSGSCLFGKHVEGVNGVAYAPVSDFEENGLKAFDNYDEAMRALHEVARQGKIISRLSMIDFIKLKTIDLNDDIV